MQLRRGFTLVELLAVIAIVGILVSLLLPAVQAARAAARKMQCANNLKQVSLATLNHVSATDRLPAMRNARHGGELDPWICWQYSILPFLEETAIHDALDNVNWRLAIAKEKPSDPQKPAVVPSYLCPATPGSPRFAALQISRGNRTNATGGLIFDAVPASDFAAALGVGLADSTAAGAWSGTKKPIEPYDSFGEASEEALMTGAKLAWVSDGLSKTVLIRERAGLPVLVSTGYEDRDLSGGGLGWIRLSVNYDAFWIVDARLDLTSAYPAINHTNRGGVFGFHPGGAHASMCDGSVRFLAKDTSHRLASALAKRSGHDNAGRGIGSLPQHAD